MHGEQESYMSVAMIKLSTGDLTFNSLLLDKYEERTVNKDGLK